MIEHNVVVVDGVEYKAVKGDCCDNCEFVGTNSCEPVPCTSVERNDGKHVIFKLHYRPKHNELPIKVIEL